MVPVVHEPLLTAKPRLLKATQARLTLATWRAAAAGSGVLQRIGVVTVQSMVCPGVRLNNLRLWPETHSTAAGAVSCTLPWLRRAIDLARLSPCFKRPAASR